MRLPLFLSLLLASSCPMLAQVLFRDDFNGRTLDKAKWTIGEWQLDQTQLGGLPVVNGGIARLPFQTYDPRHPGKCFLGSEIDTNQAFAVGKGLQFKVRMRVNTLPAGLNAAAFTYTQWNEGSRLLSDEIDIEILSKQTLAARKNPPLHLTSYRSFNNTDPNYEDTTQCDSADVAATGLVLGQFNVYTMRWWPNRVEWFVNGRLVCTATRAVPQKPMNFCLNFWAPDSSWGDAFSTQLVPAKSARQNQTYYLDIDYVEVRRLP